MRVNGEQIASVGPKSSAWCVRQEALDRELNYSADIGTIKVHYNFTTLALGAPLVALACNRALAVALDRAHCI